MKIYVSEENIEHGKRCDDETCALALAFKDAGFSGVSVGDESVDLWDASSLGEELHTKSYELSDKLKVFIELFDEGGDASPLEFELSALLPWVHDRNRFGEELTT